MDTQKNNDDLENIRKRIDCLDKQISLLLSDRLRAIECIGKVKQQKRHSITDSNREMQVLDHVLEMAKHPLFQECMSDIYKTIFEVSKKSQHFMEHSILSMRRIGIIGLGLMGGSLCKALKIKDPHIHIASIAYDSEDYESAKQQGLIDKEHKYMQDLVDAVDLIVIATPISSVLPVAKKLRSNAKKLLILDLASVKSTITTAFELLTDETTEYISSHPMAGKEKNGFQNSTALLFVQQPWIIVPHGRNSKEALQKIEELIRFV